MTATEYVVLVDHENNVTGSEEKIATHAKNLLHRAFSVFVFRHEPEVQLLLQQRALNKYHSQGLWTNTCCSHPRADENIVAAGERRLREELGIKTTLTDLGWFHYNAHFQNGLSENEIDHVLIGFVSRNIPILSDSKEVQAHRWTSLSNLECELASEPHLFTPWLTQALSIVKQHLPKFV